MNRKELLDLHIRLLGEKDTEPSDEVKRSMEMFDTLGLHRRGSDMSVKIFAHYVSQDSLKRDFNDISVDARDLKRDKTGETWITIFICLGIALLAVAAVYMLFDWSGRAAWQFRALLTWVVLIAALVLEYNFIKTLRTRRAAYADIITIESFHLGFMLLAMVEQSCSKSGKEITKDSLDEALKNDFAVEFNVYETVCGGFLGLRKRPL